MANKIVIVDYGMGNLHSVKKKLERIGFSPIVASKPQQVLSADKIILPGVGHFSMAMDNLKSSGLLDALNEVALVQQKPVLGICLGMQLMAKSSEEGNVAGLGWFDAQVVRFQIKDTLRNKVPHMGWNQISLAKENVLMDGILDKSEFYFVHAYHIITLINEDILNRTEYEYPFVSAIQKGNIYGVQYHPEKSQVNGERLLKNFCEL